MKIPEKAFYINPKNIQNKIFSLCEKESYHAAKVLRLKLGDTIVLVDGKSQGYFGLIEEIKPKAIIGSIKYIDNTLTRWPSKFSTTQQM